MDSLGRRHSKSKGRRPLRPRTPRLECLEDRRLLSLTVDANAAPQAAPDGAATQVNVPVLISVLQNDSDPDGSIDSSSVSIAQRARAGRVQVERDGRVQYTPPANRIGTDVFSYTVRDDAGALSNAATVTVEVRSAWQNASHPSDVNADGRLSPSDVLRVVNWLNEKGPQVLEQPPVALQPPPFVDVNGDGRLSARDALAAVICLNAQARGESVEGCPMTPLPLFDWVDEESPLPPGQETGADGEPSGDTPGASGGTDELFAPAQTTVFGGEYPLAGSSTPAGRDASAEVVSEEVVPQSPIVPAASGEGAPAPSSPRTSLVTRNGETGSSPLTEDGIERLERLS